MEKRNSYIKEYICGNWKYSIIFLLLFIALGCAPAGWKNLTPVSFLFFITKGFSYQKFQMTEFLYYLFFYIFPLFWINYFLENEKKDRNAAAKFRYGSRRRWKIIRLKECMEYMLRYYGQFIACVMLIDTLLVMTRHENAAEYLFAIQENYGIHTEKICLGFAIALVWRLVELLLLLEIDLCIYQYTGDTLTAFLGTFAVYLPCTLLRRGNVMILGLSSAYGAFELLAVKRTEILVINMLAGILAGIALFVIQLKKIDNLRVLFQRRKGVRHGYNI